ncbi:iron complex transport system permease protein [Rhizomicrobium palustre]|uniref:Iron complex transport system permease protein n=1 Tax=Rhizomicrobium palustre TaxID=189966 RepID=A0A846MZA5_9PROT|nr:iron ABC transporter permease [Rhizomicrobium palustre]NIK88776.1 iron complex transport system permease protein [Rhizomicrobium palustre]
MKAQRTALFVLAACFILIAWGSLSLGRYTVPGETWWELITDPDAAGLAGQVLLQVRLPRILAGIFIGAGLSAAGAAYQGIFRNPMVSPDILGASAGAGFGAAAAILASLGVIAIQLSSFTFGLIAVGLTCLAASRLKRAGDPILTLVLVGILVGSVFTALVSLAKYTADPYSKLPAITLWLMGSLSAINPSDLIFALVPIALGLVPLYLLRWHLNVLAFGEEEARALGAETTRLRWIIIFAATLLTASSVAIAGMVGWVGLVIPHLARMIVGPDYRVLLPASMLLGGSYLLLTDDLARSLMANEIPLGIITALIGAPFFLYLMMRSQRGWA